MIADALHFAILHKVDNPELPSPRNYWWNLINNEWVAVMGMEKPAPEAVLHLIKCGCTKTAMQCNCKKAVFVCVECDHALLEARDSEEVIEDNEEEEY